METDEQRAGDSSGEMNMNDEQKISRRTILNALLGGTAALWFATLLYPVLRYLNPPKVAEPRTSTVKLEGAAQLKNNSSKMFKFGQKPGLLIRTNTGDFKAFVAICTHLACTVQYRSDEGDIWCACHNGRFDLTGKNISGPPPRPLTPLRVALRGEDVFISLEA